MNANLLRIVFSLCALFFVHETSVAATKPSPTPQTKKEDTFTGFYRYLDENGSTVISKTIPPEAVPRGYQIMDAHASVIKIVPPAPTSAEQIKIANDKKTAQDLAKLDTTLRRNYSTPQDIDAAKARKLQQLKDTLEILQGSLVSTRSQLKLHETNAANIERAGKTLPDDLLKNITTLRNQEKDIQLQLQVRETELKTVSDKFDQDRARFILITKDTQAPK